MARNLKIFSTSSKPTTEGYQAEIERIIDYSKASGKQGMRRRISNLLTDFKATLILNIINSIFSLLLASEYIYSTYNPLIFQNTAWGGTNFMIHSYFLVEFSLKIYAAKNRKQYLQSSEGIIDIASLIPFFIIRFCQNNPLYEDNTSSLLNFGNLLCLVRILKFEGCLVFIVTFSKFFFLNFSLGIRNQPPTH